jgi:hypothetical protein
MRTHLMQVVVSTPQSRKARGEFESHGKQLLYLHIVYIYANIHIVYICKYTHVVCVYVCMCMYMYTYACVRVLVRIHVCMYTGICMYVRIYVCICIVCVCTHRKTRQSVLSRPLPGDALILRMLGLVYICDEMIQRIVGVRRLQ